jgi:hypothetical protein
MRKAAVTKQVPRAALEISDLCKGAHAFLQVHGQEEGELVAIMRALFLRIDGLTDELVETK